MPLEGRIALVDGDITGLDVEAVVNAANDRLAPGGGVCGAIHRAAGPELEAACRAIGGCATGGAVATPGYRLKARHVIHAVGPVWRGGTEGEDGLLASCYRQSLAIAEREDMASIAFPSISTGIYGFPIERASRIAVAEVAGFLEGHERPGKVVLCCFGAADAAVYRAALAERGIEA